MDERELIKFTMHNKKLIAEATKCGCIHCMCIFEKDLIKNYTDKDDTAICPHCGIDMVLPEGIGCQITVELLKKLKQFWL